MEKNNLLPHDGFPYSRDYGLTLKCKNSTCPFISGNQCSCPSSVTLDYNGKCELFTKYKSQ